MMLNVWGIVWRMQKKIIRWTSDDAGKNAGMPPKLRRWLGSAFWPRDLSFWVSFPMLFFMGAASHYILFSGSVIRVTVANRLIKLDFHHGCEISARSRIDLVHFRGKNLFPCST